MASRKLNPVNNCLGDLDINPRILDTALRVGCTSAESILLTSQWELRHLTGLSAADIKILVTAVAQHVLPKQVSCWEMIQKQESPPSHITTGCPQLDSILGGGIPRCGITEIAGEAGSGKTQLSLQLALNAQLPKHMGGFGKGVAYICTEDRFRDERLSQMIRHMQKMYPQGPKSYRDHLFHIHIADMDRLLDCVLYQLPLLVARHQIGLVIIDSVAAVYRCEDTVDFNRILNLRKLGYKLHQIAFQNNIAVVAINQATAAFGRNRLYGMNTKDMPALGLSWANLITTRLMLSRTELFIRLSRSIVTDANSKQIPEAANGNQVHKKEIVSQAKSRVRILDIVFCPWLARKSASYIITQNGFEGADVS